MVFNTSIKEQLPQYGVRVPLAMLEEVFHSGHSHFVLQRTGSLTSYIGCITLAIMVVCSTSHSTYHCQFTSWSHGLEILPSMCLIARQRA